MTASRTHSASNSDARVGVARAERTITSGCRTVDLRGSGRCVDCARLSNHSHDGTKRTISSGMRVCFIISTVALSTALAIAGHREFLKDFSAFLLFLLAFFTPWSAINLVDYYFVTKERYDVPALFDPDGRYGRWNLTGIAVYVFGVLIQVPFLATGFYTGALVERLGGVDIS
jgi:hypothetical protein